MSNQGLVDYLKSCGVCHICQLRFLKARGDEYNDITLTNDRLNVKFSHNSCEQSCKKQRTNICPTCLGLFSKDFQKELVGAILQTPDFSKYDCPNIVVAVSMPILLQIRQLSMWFALLRKFPNSIDKTIMPDVPIKEAVKLLLIPTLCKELNKNYDVNGLTININLTHVFEEEEVNKIAVLHKVAFKNNGKRIEISRGLLEKSYNPTQLSAELFEQYLPIPPLEANESLKLDSIGLTGPTVYVAARYRKTSRQLSHTPWILNQQRIMEDSIEEIIMRNIVPHFTEKKQNVVFMSSGREDVDVRCLGKGRPFVLEIQNAMRMTMTTIEANQIEEQINNSGKLSVRDLQIVQKEELKHIKTGEEHKRKYYRALCALKEPVTLDILKKLQISSSFIIQQKTPIRVLHRRPLHTRPRTIFSLKAFVQRENSRVLVIDIESQAGTYIKELVHGEFGRTEPSLASIIGKPIDILALDVLAIDLDWPPEIQKTEA